MKDELGKRMKENYEQRSRTFLPRRTYTIIRLDGKSFHTFTKGMKRPYDKDFAKTMDRTAMSLFKEIQGCKMAYVQSDEISLLLTDFETPQTEGWFNGNVQKIVSVSASIATAKFNQLMLLSKLNKILIDGMTQATLENTAHDTVVDSIIRETTLAHFDSRVFSIPDPVEVENYFVWRQKDAIRNSLSMMAQSLYSPKELHGKNQKDMHDMIHDKGQNWNDMDNRFKRGGLLFKDSNGVHGYRNLDILKEREEFSTLIPKYRENE